MASMRAAHDHASTASAKRIPMPNTYLQSYFYDLRCEHHINRGIKSIDRRKHHPIVASYRHRSTVQVPE